jgi:hypothetical protein
LPGAPSSGGSSGRARRIFILLTDSRCFVPHACGTRFNHQDQLRYYFSSLSHVVFGTWMGSRRLSSQGRRFGWSSLCFVFLSCLCSHSSFDQLDYLFYYHRDYEVVLEERFVNCFFLCLASCYSNRKEIVRTMLGA